jgi:phosphoenolpyruvate carboxykinase (GTP)
VLEWIIHRCDGRARAQETRIGLVPDYEDFNVEALDFDAGDFEKVMAFDPEEWRQEVISQSELFLRLFHTMPKQLVYERELLSARLS